MDHISSQRDKVIGQDYLSKFHLASSSLLSTQNTMDQVFPPYGQPAAISSAGQLEFRPPQPSYTNSAGIQYSLTQNYDIGLTDRYLQPGYSHSFLTEDFYPSLCPPPPAHLSTQQYAISVADSTPSMLPPQQSSQLSPMLRGQRQSPQQLPAPTVVHGKLNSVPRAPSHSPSMYSSQRQSPQHSPITAQQHFSSPVGASNFSYPSSQCSQRNDPPLGNMHMTKVGNNSFNNIPQFSPQSFLAPSQHSNMRVSNSKAVPKEDDTRGHFMNHLTSGQRGIQRESKINTGTQNHPKSSIYPTSSASSQQTVTSSSSKQQSVYQIGGSVPALTHRTTLSANRPYLPQNSNLSNSSSVNRAPTLSQMSTIHNPTISRASNNLPPPFDAIDSIYPYIPQTQKNSRENPLYLTPPINNLTNSSAPLSSFERRNAASLSAASDTMPSNNPYSMYSVFLLSDQSNGGMKGGRGASTRARGRGGRMQNFKTGTHEDANPIQWYKCSDPLLTSSYQSDVEAMQADTAMESSMFRQIPQTDPASHRSAKEAHGLKSGSNSSHAKSNQLVSNPGSVNATKAAALASIQLKQEIMDNLTLTKSKPQVLNNSVSDLTHHKNAVSNATSEPGVIMQPSPAPGATSSISNAGGLTCKQSLPTEKEKGILHSNNSITCQPPIASRQAKLTENNGQHDKSFLGKQMIPSVFSVSKQPARKLHNQDAGPTDKKSVSARERVFHMWKAGQVVGRVPGKGKTKSNLVNSKSTQNLVSTAQPSTVANSGCQGNSHSNLTLQKSNDSKAVSAPKVNADLVTSQKRIPHSEERKKSKSLNPGDQTKQDLRYVMFHGHKLICLKSHNEAVLLLCQFQFECFPDKGMGAINNCIDRALRIKKRVLDHPQKDKITAFLEKNGYSVLNSVLAINLDDARRVYHHMYKLTSCSTATCVVELSHQAVDLDTVSMPLIKRTLPLEMFKRVKREKKSFEDNSYGRVSSKTDHHWQSGVEDVTKDHTGSNRLTHISRHHREKDDQSLGSDHTELYGKDKDLDDNADLIIVEAMEDPYIIKKCPDVPMTGGLCNTIQGQVRSYLHKNENYLVVEDLGRIFSDTDIYERLEKDNYILYSCTAEIGDFLNGINKNFPRLRSLQQCLIKGNDIGAHITEEDYITSNVAPVVGNDASKRPICKQEIFDDLCSSPKQRRRDFAPSNEEQKMESVESPGANSLSDDSDSQENSATVIFNEEEHLASDCRRVDDLSLNNSSNDTIKLTIGILNDIKIRSESRATESSALHTSKIDSHEAAFPKNIIPVTVTNDAINGPSIVDSDMHGLPGVSDSQSQVSVGVSVSGSDICCNEEPMEMSDNLSDTTATAQSAHCDAESDQDKRPATTETETSSSQSEIDASNDCANFKENTELFNTDKATGKDVSDEHHGGTSNAKDFLFRVHGLKLRDKLLETKRNTDLSNSSVQLSSDLRSCTTSTGESYGEITACLPMKSVLNDDVSILQQTDSIGNEQTEVPPVTDVYSESNVLTFEKISVFPESFNDPNPSFNAVPECNDVSVSDNPSAVDVENNNQSPGQSVIVDTDNNNTIEHISDVVPKADIKKVVSKNLVPASKTDSDSIETTNVPPVSSVLAPKPPSEFSDLTLVDGFRVRIISKSEATDSSYDGSLGSHTESSDTKKHPESNTSLPAPSAVSSSFGQPSVFKINLHHGRTLDDIDIMDSSSTDPLAAAPLNPFTSKKTQDKGYSKLCRQNSALINIVHILRKELAITKDGKEKAERICKYYEGVIHDITSTYRSGDEETPISIPDDDFFQMCPKPFVKKNGVRT